MIADPSWVVVRSIRRPGAGVNRRRRATGRRGSRPGGNRSQARTAQQTPRTTAWISTLYDDQPAQALEYVREGSTRVALIKPERVFTVLNLRRVEASALRELDRLDEALVLYRQAIERARRELDRHESVLQEGESIHGYLGGERQPRRLGAHADRARIRIAQESRDGAIALLEAVRALRRVVAYRFW